MAETLGHGHKPHDASNMSVDRRKGTGADLNILIFPLPELGHILPTLALTQYLASLGHHVVFLTAQQFANLIAGSGGTIRPFFSQDADAASLSGGGIWYRYILDNGRESSSSGLRKLADSALDNGDFDLVLCDHILGVDCLRYLVKRMGGKHVVSFSTALFNWNDFRTNESEVPTIVLCPQIFELEQFRRRSDRIFYVEPSLAPIDIGMDASHQPSSDSPLVVAAFGTQSMRYRHLSELFLIIRELAKRQPQLQFLIATGHCKTSELIAHLGELPNLAVQQQIPQRRVLQRASAIVTHGGLGSIKEAVCAGVPLIVFPMLYDQPFNAMRVRHHGLGEAIFPEKCSLDVVETSVRNTVDGKYSAEIKRMQSHFLAMEKEQPSHLLLSKWMTDAQSGRIAR